MSQGDSLIRRSPSSRALTGRPDKVYVGVEVLHLWDLEVKTESFSCELIIYTRWRCPKEEREAAMAEGGDGLDETCARTVPTPHPGCVPGRPLAGVA